MILENKNNEIDWHAQWEAHARHFKNGLVHLDLREYGYSSNELLYEMPLKLQPGPGFGDLSHPTTRLMIRLMQGKVVGQYVVDVGCGSGVLSLSAMAMGASAVNGIDIDIGAIAHARANALLNNMPMLTFFDPDSYYLPKEVETCLVLMNMISSEQENAWACLPSLHNLSGLALVSGILKEQKKKYIKQCELKGWKFLSEIEEEGWLALQFLR